MLYSTSMARAAMLLVLAWLACVLGGCGEHLAGTHDVELDCQVDPGLASVAAASLAVRERLAAGSVYADVRASPSVKNGLRILVDDASLAKARDLLQWRGGLLVYRLDHAATDALAPATSLEDAAARVDRTPAIEGRLLLVERTGDDQGAVRVVFRVPVADLTQGVVGAVSRGKGVDVSLTAAASGALAAQADALRSGDALVARGDVAYRASFGGDVSTDTPPDLRLDVPGALPAYAHAHAAARLLASKVLPPLALRGEERAPVDVVLAAGCLLVPFALSAVWLLFVRRFDRAHPEPWWLVGATFVLGCFSCVPAGLCEYALMHATPWLNPAYATLGGRFAALPLAIVVFTVVVGASEELVKFAATAAFAARRPEFDEPVDGIIYGAASALGFAAVENVKYFAVGRLSAATIVARTFVSIPAHLVVGAVWGYALGARLARPKTRLWPWLLLAATIHGTFDACLSTDGGTALALVVEMSAAALFVVLLRRTLRYGPLPQATAGADRTHLRVGSPLPFVLAACAFVASVIPLTILASELELASPRRVMPLLVLGAALVLLSGLAARAVAATIPLDVVTDESGVTYAGAFRSWPSITRIDAEPGTRSYLLLASTDGPLSIGPFASATRERFLGEVIRWRRARPRT